MRTLTARATAVLLVVGCSDADPESRSHSAWTLPDEDPSCAHTLTTYAGDCSAPPPVDPSTAFVVHHGPESYDDPSAVLEYVLLPGEERTRCAYSKIDQTADFFFDRYDLHSRPGSHHVVLYAADPSIPDGAHDDCALRGHDAAVLGVIQGGLDGAVLHYPPPGGIAAENRGVARKLGAGQTVVFELHAVNATDQPLLEEGWAVLFSRAPSDVTEVAGTLAFDGGLSMQIPPHTLQTVSNSCPWSGPGEIRVLDLFAHMHAHGRRLSAWAVHTDSSGSEIRDLVYESYDWSILDLVRFDSITENPPVTFSSGHPGAMSGILRLAPGDRIEYQCAIDNTTDATLAYAARAFAGEMCNLFGTFAPAGGPFGCVGN